MGKAASKFQFHHEGVLTLLRIPLLGPLVKV